MHAFTTHTLGIRRIGFLLCFQNYKALTGRYPTTPDELSRVTSTRLSQKRFDAYASWYYRYTGQNPDA